MDVVEEREQSGKELPKWREEEELAFDVSPGVRCSARTVTAGDLLEAVSVLELNPADPYLELRSVSYGGGVTRLSTVREMMEQLQQQGKRVVAMINADFFSSLGVPSGLQITDGELVTSPAVTKVLMAVEPDGTVRLAHGVKLEATVTVDGTGASAEVDAVNRTRARQFDRHLFLYTHRFGETTRTTDDGVEAVLAPLTPAAPLRAGEAVPAVVQEVREGGGTAIGEAAYVLSGTGDKADWLRQHLKPGTQVSLAVGLDQGIGRARQVLSGSSTLAFVLLEDGSIPEGLLDQSIKLNTDRHPRTVLATRQGKLYAVVIDGRQAGHSDGMTLAETAAYLQQMGMEQAINVDGGGSTTCLVRLPGDIGPSLLNRPSDGFEREVGNALAIISTAPQGPLERLVVLPAGPAVVYAGSRIAFLAKGQDGCGNAVAPDGLSWSAEPEVGEIDTDGLFTAADGEAAGSVTVRTGEVSRTVELRVTSRISRLVLEPESALLEPNGSIQFRPRAYGPDGEELLLSADRLVWSADGGHVIGPDGVLHAGAEAGGGTVRIACGSVQAEAAYQIGKPPLILADFERLDGLQAAETHAVPGSVRLTRTERPHPVRFGRFSGRLTYDFTGMPGASRAIVRLLSGGGEPVREVEGAPDRFGLWVYGDGSNHRLRICTIDANENPRNLVFGSGRVDWTGWRYVYAEIPSNTRYPLRVTQLELLETDDTLKGSGVLYLDNLRAEYVRLDEDLEGPVFDSHSPSPDTAVNGPVTELSVRVTDEESGIDAASIKVWLNGALQTHTFDRASGRISVALPDPLPAGPYSILAEAADQSGNPAAPAASWQFIVL
ncbi:hypothetical protein J31TS4_04480 [Paenibacillus sp. J31TS4]|uniref:phosphodiester glycosidase family protein n=1 Tax=Paenibacillus sp. J31TS4 TaxID=2807195 RepID=UPI001B135558|nr:phosphodiester glycosidase family protein [Paenibacillus sp. J31TS4]GIP37168.1 hypothetical protein J31TS4_04480 [Paenibacillus sp. J31TS4]